MPFSSKTSFILFICSNDSSRKYSFKIFCISFCKIKSNQNIFNILKGALAKNGSLAFAEGLACALGAKANVPFVRLAKIELKKMCGGENKKYRRVGNECRLTRCPFEIWSVCWSLVEMVCFCVNVQFLVVCLWLHCRLLGLLITVRVLPKVGHYTTNV